MRVSGKNGAVWMLRSRAWMLALGLSVIPAIHVAKAAEYSPENPFIAGVKPNQRPEGAPILKTYRKDAGWKARALHGVSEPYPPSIVQFLEDQGAWYTPFIHPGMTPPYDIRGWHKRMGAKAAGD